MYKATALFFLLAVFHGNGVAAAPITTRAEDLKIVAAKVTERSNDPGAMMQWGGFDDAPSAGSTSTSVVDKSKRADDPGAMMQWGGFDKAPSAEGVGSTSAFVVDKAERAEDPGAMMQWGGFDTAPSDKDTTIGSDGGMDTWGTNSDLTTSTMLL
ncbi:uncharacterized protein RSE6_14333 [Rhynchosporium secalis]|uniref:Uncharacterized protein n=1 Tax=Rhynchosporium secalis TaxID=38038 RepID=A0A1E1MV18_RHYSE|nr:uncharacterized protein RSE6_14333 [Rhynchosporium secalis]